MGGLKIPAPTAAPTSEAGATSPAKDPNSPARVHGAAQQFEALLLEQILQTMHESGGWLGSGSDGAADSAMGFAEQQFASVLAKQGGLGLADMIAAGLERRK